MRTTRFFIPAVLYYAVIYFLSSRPQIPIAPLFPLQDKVFHIFLFAGFGFCLFYGLARIKRTRKRRSLFHIFIVIGIVAAALDEFHQAFVPGRSADLADIAADVLGILAGWLFVRFLLRLPAGRRLFGGGAAQP